MNDVLDSWLRTSDHWVICRERLTVVHGREVVRQTAVKSVRSGWDTMRIELGVPDGWGPKLIRHSMSSLLRKRRVDPWELAGQLGHRILGTSESYAIYDPDYLGTVRQGIDDILDDIRRTCGGEFHPRFTQE